mmetsp:Transcript_1733/g.3719  ORF Transcript_1733/g.3719 Transcript_1733/m.3719 type:complete len:320 (-) Transcript_1733:57-1016(-)|eukprot:CAMPEP_0170237308 /NCGR_PEP_ID=MMETSP0116_2-20130129/18404_1 /TAXON_ID=400756 /ORGANISM="Durinskia baltica, Strain CSIRO CS-38" /LENGTH=319 /DNA_ID=CAMNT_0010488111 /DNA_START=92 /DNA_END=1051 /DNA_ORIENTATION=-
MVPRVDSKEVIRVGICSNIAGIQEAVEFAFAASSLTSNYVLCLEEVETPGACPEVLLADPGKVAPLVDKLDGLRWLQSTWAGVNALGSSMRRDYFCTRLAGCFGPQMAEYVLGAILSEDWQRMRACQQRGEWSPGPFKNRRRLDQMTLGCLGVGEIAACVAERARALGMRTIGFASYERQVCGFDTVTTDLDLTLSQADIIVSVLPSTKKTRGLLDGGRLHACGADKLFINVGRGDIISEQGVLDALANGWLRGAVLDVFPEEPLPAESKLWKHQAVTATPHIAAVTHPDDAAKVFIENLELWMDGENLRFLVDLDKGY